MIETARLRLRPARMADLKDFHAVMSDPAAMRYWSSAPHADTDATERYLAAMVAGAGEMEDYAIEERDRPGRVIGKAGCWRVMAAEDGPPGTQVAEVGYILHPDCWGRGYAQEALAVILPRVFARFPAVAAVIADVDPRNAASIRLLESLGFAETGRQVNTIEVAGAWCDSVYFALPRPGQDAGPCG